MKKPTDLKPVVNARISTIGNNKAIVLPKWFSEQWDIANKRKYKIHIIKEIAQETNSVIGIQSSNLAVVV